MGETGRQANRGRQQRRKSKGDGLFFFFFWFRSGRGCGPGPARLRGALPLCGRASCASCAPSCPCGGGAGSGGLAGLVEQKQRGEERGGEMKERADDFIKRKPEMEHDERQGVEKPM